MAEVAEAVIEEPKPSKKKLWVLLLLVLIAGAAGGAYLIASGDAAKKPAVAAKPVLLPAQYYKLDPAFVVNFEAEQLVRFLQVTVELMTRDPAVIDLLKLHDPMIRNDLLLLLSNQQYAVISTAAGKETLRAEALETVRRIVDREGGNGGAIEAVYFTSFVMQ